MTHTADVERWQQLVGRAVEDCHVRWVSGADTALLSAARRSARARRLLARGLAMDAAPATFSLSGIEALASLPDCDWVLAEGAMLRSRVADLGVLALAPGLRKMVDRAAVRELRASLGARRYDWLLSGGLDIDARIGDVWQLQGWRLVDQFLSDRTNFRLLIERRGLHEVGGALRGAPALVRERVRLLFAPDARGGSAQPWLPPGCALRLLRSGGSDDVAFDELAPATAATSIATETAAWAV